MRSFPFTARLYLSLFETYNSTIWPAQVVAYGLGILAVLLTLRPLAAGGRIAFAVLSAFWLWNGIAYHLMHFFQINFAALGFAVLFTLQGALFAAMRDRRPSQLPLPAGCLGLERPAPLSVRAGGLSAARLACGPWLAAGGGVRSGAGSDRDLHVRHALDAGGARAALSCSDPAPLVARSGKRRGASAWHCRGFVGAARRCRRVRTSCLEAPTAIGDYHSDTVVRFFGMPFFRSIDYRCTARGRSPRRCRRRSPSKRRCLVAPSLPSFELAHLPSPFLQCRSAMGRPVPFASSPHPARHQSAPRWGWRLWSGV